MPDQQEANPFTEMLLSPDPRAYQRHYQFDITPVSDNRPFFFYTVQPADVWKFFLSASRDPEDYKINRAVPLLFGLMGVSLVAMLLMLALPPLLLGSRLPRKKGVRLFLFYFVAIGAAYILIEVALIQKFVLFLGHPTYALTVVIFSMLVSSGLGSYMSARVATTVRGPALAAAFVMLLAFILRPLLTVLVGMPLLIKFFVTVLLVFPAGFTMGMPFPMGLKLLERWHRPSVRWAWSLNAAASVVGSAGSIFCAIYLGLMQTLLAGVALYGAALAVSAIATPATRAQG